MGGDRGVTLIEMMVTVALLAIVLAIGVPSFTAMIKANRLTAATNTLVGAIHLARSEAIKRGTRVTLCPSSDGTTCATSGGWAQGWLVFVDANHNATFDSDTDTLLRVQEALPSPITIQGNGSTATYLSFVGSGQSQETDGGFQAGTLTVCDDRSGNVGKAIVLAATGRVHIDSGVECP